MSIESHALTGAYAVDALDEADRSEVERHLAACATCRHEVRSLREAAGVLSGAVATPPSATLRPRVLTSITEVRPLPPVVSAPQVGRARGGGRTRSRWAAGWLMLAASVASAVAVSEPWTSSQVTVSEASRVMSAADVQVVHRAVAGGGSLIWYRSVSMDRAVVTYTRLAPLPTSHAYELWLQRPDRSMAPAGFLIDGAATVVLNGRAGSALGGGLTVEPAGGSTDPTTAPVALVSFVRS